MDVVYKSGNGSEVYKRERSQEIEAGKFPGSFAYDVE